MDTDRWGAPYLPLPGQQVGAHDWIEFTGESDTMAEHGLPLQEGLTWWHHADKSPAGKRPKGGRCGGGNLALHAASNAESEDLSRVTLHPSLLCRMCGRHIWVRDGKAQDLGHAHEEVD